MSKADTDKKRSEMAELSILESLRLEYEKTKNPACAMEAFVRANQREDLDIATPGWVLHWICNAFTEYYNSAGKDNLESLLGFQFGRGKDPSKDFKRRFIAERDSALLWRMCVIRSQVPEISIEASANIVIKRMKERAPQKMENVSSSTLKRKYIKEGRTERESNILDEIEPLGRESLVEWILSDHGIELNDNPKNKKLKPSTINDLEESIRTKPWGNAK